MIWYASALLAISILIYKGLPILYIGVRESVISASNELKKENKKIQCSWIAALICILPSLFFYMLSNDKGVTSFILMLGVIAYCDLTTRWIPDCLLYGAVWLSLGLRSGQLLEQGITGAALFCLPVFILQGFSLLTKRKGCFASGDLYLIPAIGFWFVPELAPALMACTLMLASLVSRYVKEVPFITCILPIFTGYKICEHFLLF